MVDLVFNVQSLMFISKYLKKLITLLSSSMLNLEQIHRQNIQTIVYSATDLHRPPWAGKTFCL